ncbi:CoA transferase [Microbacterium saperdae]|uniref:CoA transferase family III n=1 Tax=Microbacterium saperdae TaxID=69368 RepID=A0A543BKT2_9MICO|nr:CoA transferase [Microbacterium saperdae]TQL85439.1 CoA transferase family III [Microbacterium saperdae]GGM54172.1 CoA transferase [Microbacterium saperdae]
MNAGRHLLSRVWTELGADPRLIRDVHAASIPVPLPSRLSTGDLAWASVAAVVCAAQGDAATLDPHRIAAAYRSDRFLTIDGTAPPVWSPFSGFWRTVDGWVRTHGNYAHHAAGLRSALLLDTTAGADQVRDALAVRPSSVAVAAITAAGGLAVPVLLEDPDVDAMLRSRPLLDVRRIDSPTAPPRRAAASTGRPLDGIRVLDLTRVIAGPVCTRTLAVLGADVLRIDPPHLPEPGWQHFDTGHGKRTALLDARSAHMHDLLSAADVVVLGYRPDALDRLGLAPGDLTERYPGLLVARLSAWGAEHPRRAGFDSLVQAESGIAWIESPDGDRPGALPAQALDHSAGYLLAAAVITLIRRRAEEGGSWQVQTSLRRVAAELLGMPRRPEPAAEVPFDPAHHVAHFDVAGQTLVTAAPAIPGFDFAAPRPWGEDQPRW